VLPEARNVIYKRGHTIDPKGFFVVEVSTAFNSLYVCAYSAVGPESFVVEFKGQSARETLQRFGSDFNIMAMCLTFRQDRLVLRNPRNMSFGRQQSESSPPRSNLEGSTNIELESTSKKKLKAPKTQQIHQRSMRGYEDPEEKKDPHSLFDVEPDESEKRADSGQGGGGQLSDEDFGDDEVEQITGGDGEKDESEETPAVNSDQGYSDRY